MGDHNACHFQWPWEDYIKHIRADRATVARQQQPVDPWPRGRQDSAVFAAATFLQMVEQGNANLIKI